jgi:hypothetical protein
MNADEIPVRMQKAALDMAMVILAGYDTITDEVVTSAIAGALGALEHQKGIYGDAKIDIGSLRRSIEDKVNIWTTEASSLTDQQGHVPWLQAERAEISWNFWDRYRSYIARDLPPAAVKHVDRITDVILGQLESPRRDGLWDRRGMVVGQVQSGKTANYSGLICKAADAGYRLIVILAGMHDSLRSQTQERIDEGILGWDTQFSLLQREGNRSHRTGVGAMVRNSRLIPISSFTTSAQKGDFKMSMAQQVAPHIGSDPVVLVVKKNKSILENLIEWTTREKVSAYEREIVLGQPLLVIDDEADNASVNTKDVEWETDEDGALLNETDPATINRLIRTLLNSFEQSAYVAYTATPFANIFIYSDSRPSKFGDDLFPRSFIVRIPPPSNYVGAPRVFGLPAAESPDGEELPALPVVRKVSDQDGFIENPADKNERIGPLPESLREAIRAFVLTCAARAARGQGTNHSSMLVHVTRFVDVQKQVRDAVQDELESIQRRLRHGQDDGSLREKLREAWEGDFAETTSEIGPPEGGQPMSWSELEPYVVPAALKIQALAINGTSADALIYKDHRATGLSVIAVGGDKLSRGLTLEGLSVSYYLRTSKMYDTLLQMGRWFGYRPGYLDLCRLYTTGELAQWYRDITVANEELNREFDRMDALGETPQAYGLRVRSHPDGLLVTARTKMRESTEMRLSFGGVCPQTTVFDRDAEVQSANASLVERFLAQQTTMGHYSEAKRESRGVHMWSSVKGTDVARFLEEFRVSSSAYRVNGSLMARYIKACIAQGELSTWSVALPSIRRDEDARAFAGVPLGLLKRAARTPRDDGRSFSVRAVLNPPDELLDLDDGERDAAAADAAARFAAGRLKTSDGKAPSAPDGIGARAARSPTRGLLILYAIDPIANHASPGADVGFIADLPLFGLAVSFPRTDRGVDVSYRVNNVFVQMELGGA